MKRFIYIIVAAAAVLSAASCSKPQPAEPNPQPTEKKTIVAYFFGRDLSYYFSLNLASMERAVASGKLGDNAVMVFVQTSSTDAEIRRMSYDNKSQKCVTEVLESIELPSALTSAGFAEYMKKTMDYAPAESYSVIFLGHARAWLPKTPLASPATYSLMQRFVPSFEKMPGAAVTRDLGENNVTLDMDELAEGLISTGVKFDCLYFDVCFMSSLEAAYELRKTADWIIASPCEIMGEGSPYDRILVPLFNGDYKVVCDEYVSFYESYDYPSGCIAAIECSKLEAVAGTVKKINALPAAEGFDAANVQTYEGRTSGRYAGHWFYDAEDYFRQICADSGLVSEFSSRLDECVHYRGHTESFFSAYNSRFNEIKYYSGISLTPDEKCIGTMKESADRDMLEYYNPSLRQTAWYKATH